MPYTPPMPCHHPGCPNLTRERYCKIHEKQYNREYNHYRRDPETNKRYGTSWRMIRNRYIASHPLCERCLAEGRYTPADIVHHIVPLRESNDNSDDNLMSICQSHHSSIHLSESNKHRG